MDQTLNNPELKYQLLADFKHFEDKMNGEANSPIHKIRQDAISVFDKLGFPIKTMEEWKYTNLNTDTKNQYRQILIPHSNKLTEEDIKNLNIPEIDGSTLVLVNGRYSAKLSKINNNDESIFIGSFSDGLSKHNDVVMKHFAKYADYKVHSMSALNTAFASDGVFIYVPKNKTLEKHILIVNIADSREENILLQPRNLFVLEEGASASISEITFSIGDKPSLNNTVTEIVVSPNARLDHHRIQNDSHEACQVSTTQVNQLKDSY